MDTQIYWDSSVEHTNIEDLLDDFLSLPIIEEEDMEEHIDVGEIQEEKKTTQIDSNIRKEKIDRYLEKKKKRKWSKKALYTSRQNVANSRPRINGRFLPIDSEFIPISEIHKRNKREKNINK